MWKLELEWRKELDFVTDVLVGIAARLGTHSGRSRSRPRTSVDTLMPLDTPSPSSQA